jgi:hypothetical protein
MAETALVSRRTQSAAAGWALKFAEGETPHTKTTRKRATGVVTRTERTMDQEERKEQFGAWLRRAWNAVVRTAEAMERTPLDELFDRVDRLERQAAALKKEGTARNDGH